MDYKAIVKAMTDPENQPHQWKDEALEGMFIYAVDEIERLREALVREREDNLWNAYNTGIERPDGEWTHCFMSDGEWLVGEIGLDPKLGYYPADKIKEGIPTAARAALKEVK